MNARKEQKERILHHSMATELSPADFDKVSGGTGTCTYQIYLTDTGSECRSDSGLAGD